MQTVRFYNTRGTRSDSMWYTYTGIYICVCMCDTIYIIYVVVTNLDLRDDGRDRCCVGGGV